MAVLSATDDLDRRIPVGDRVDRTFTVTTGAGAADEWIDTGLSFVEAVVGFAVLGAASSPVNFLLRRQGTGSAVVDNSAVGIEAVGAVVVQVTVRGKV